MAAVFVADVEAAGERRRPVDDDDLPMVAEVDRLKEHAAHREEVGHLDARLRERALVPAAEGEAAEAVHEEPHVHSALRRRHEALAEPAPRRVVPDEVVLRVHVVARPVDGVAQGLVRGVALGEDVDVVAARRPQAREVLGEAEEPLLERGRRSSGATSCWSRVDPDGARGPARARPRRAAACGAPASAPDRGRRAGTPRPRRPARGAGSGSRRSSPRGPCVARGPTARARAPRDAAPCPRRAGRARGPRDLASALEHNRPR